MRKNSYAYPLVRLSLLCPRGEGILSRMAMSLKRGGVPTSCTVVQSCLQSVAIAGANLPISSPEEGCVGTHGTCKCDPKGGAVSNHANLETYVQCHPAQQDHSWYAIQTRSRHEKLVACQLQTRGVCQYLPIVVETHRWSDRRKRVEVPLFPGYVFVRVLDSNERRVDVLRIPGVVRFVGSSSTGTAIPDTEIEAVRTLVEGNMPWTSFPFLRTGQRVRIRGGAMDGLEGILLRRDGEDRLVISIDAIQRSLSISIKGYDLEAI